MKQRADQETDKAAAIARLQRLATEADDAGDDQAAATYTLADPEALDSEAERIKARQQEFERRAREKREQRARERAAATERNEKAMQAQREADTSDAQRRVEEARARAAPKDGDDSPAPPDRKRRSSKRQRRKVLEQVKPTDHPRPIMPRAVAHVEPNADHYYLARFSSAVHREPGGQLLMGFATEGERGPTLPANVWAMGLAAAEKRGAVVPLALRIWVASVLHTPLNARHGLHPIELVDLTLRKFLAWVYTGKALPQPARYWPPLLKAREVINSTELPFEYAGNLWSRPVVTLATPLTRPGLDDPWPVTVHLPPGDGNGPPITFSRLQYWSVGDAACYRALINLAYRWHIEGKRLMPAPRGTHWLQRRVPKLYEKLTDDDMDAICYPPGTGAKRRDQRIADAHAALNKLVKSGDAVSVDGRLLPP